MELRHLGGFVTVAEELSFGRAAERLHVSQPALSRMVKQLEAELGTELLDRSTHHVGLTAAGAAFLEEARAALSQLELAARAAREAGIEKPSPLRLGHTEWTEELLAPLLRSFRRRVPGAELVISQTDRPWQGARLLNGALDIVLSRTPAEDASLESQLVLDEPLVVALPSEHVLADAHEVNLAELAGEVFILFPRYLCPCAHDCIVAACDDAGLASQPALQAPSLTSVAILVAAGMGVSLVPSSTVGRLGTGDIVYRSVGGRTPTVPLIAAWRRRDRSPTVREFLGAAREMGPLLAALGAAARTP